MLTRSLNGAARTNFEARIKLGTHLLKVLYGETGSRIRYRLVLCSILGYFRRFLISILYIQLSLVQQALSTLQLLGHHRPNLLQG